MPAQVEGKNTQKKYRIVLHIHETIQNVTKIDIEFEKKTYNS